MADNKEKFTCTDCGKEVEYEGGLAMWAKKNPDKVRCAECFDKFKKAPAAKKSTGKTESGYSSSQKKSIDAKMFKQAFDELRAEFADDLDAVKEYLGGWTSTLVINRSK